MKIWLFSLSVFGYGITDLVSGSFDVSYCFRIILPFAEELRRYGKGMCFFTPHHVSTSDATFHMAAAAVAWGDLRYIFYDINNIDLKRYKRTAKILH